MTPRPHRHRRIGALAVAAALVATGAVGCGADEPSDRKLTPSEVARLRDHLSAVRLAAAQGNADAARSQLRDFRREVRRLAEANALNDERRRHLTDGARQAEARVEAEIGVDPPDDQPPAPPTDADPAPPPSGGGEEANGDAKPGKEDKPGKSKGRGKGNAGDDDDDD